MRLTRHLWRTTVLAYSAGFYVVWSLACMSALLIPATWQPAYLLANTLLLAAATMVGTRVNALAEAAAPRAVRGRYLAAFQYAFTAAGIVAPAAVALFSVAAWLPWLIVAITSAVAGCALPYLARHLPHHAVTGQAAPEQTDEQPLVTQAAER